MANNQLLASDNFSSGSLAAGWTALPTIQTCQITGSAPFRAEARTTAAACGQYWSALTWPSDQICEVTLGNFVAEPNTAILLYTRNNLAGSTYIANITDGVVVIERIDSGTPTTLISVSATAALGDVFTFAAIGSCLAVYKNGARIAYIGDATYTSGYPAFVCSSTTAVIDAQVASWRGYSAIQQDGIWTKQGVVLSATNAELAGTPAVGTGVTAFEGMRQEGGAVILSGTVYKAYFSAPEGVCYAESSDGITWVRYSGNPVIAGYAGLDVFKLGSTYYLWAQTTSAPGTGPAFMFTSTDGVTWTGPTSTNLTVGSSGQWDQSAFFGLHIADVIGGLFYGLYSTAINPNTGKSATGLATSPDGVTWTKYAGNPILLGVFAGSQILKVGNTYYLYGTNNQPGQGNPTMANFDPLEVVRYQSTDLTHWTNPTKSIHPTGLAESLNSKEAGVYLGALQQLSNRVAMYYIGSPGDSTGPQIYQGNLALAPIGTTLAGIVSFPEDGTQQIAADNFTSGLGNLSPNWTTVSGNSPLQIVAGNLVEASTLNAACAAYYNAASFGANQYSEITIATLSGPFEDQYTFPFILAQTGANSFYGVQITSPTGSLQSVGSSGLVIFKKVNGSNTILQTAGQYTPQVGDVIRIASSLQPDGTIIITVYQNNFQILQAQDYNPPFIAGFPGMFVFATDALIEAQISKWAGGNTNIIPPYPPPIPPIPPGTPATIIGFSPNWYEGQNNAGLSFYVAPGSINGVVYQGSLQTLNIPINPLTGLLNAPVTVYFWLGSNGQIQQASSLPPSGPGLNVYPIAAVMAINVLTGTRPNGFAPQITQAPGIAAVIDLRPITQNNFQF